MREAQNQVLPSRMQVQVMLQLKTNLPSPHHHNAVPRHQPSLHIVHSLKHQLVQPLEPYQVVGSGSVEESLMRRLE